MGPPTLGSGYTISHRTSELKNALELSWPKSFPLQMRQRRSTVLGMSQGHTACPTFLFQALSRRRLC